MTRLILIALALNVTQAFAQDAQEEAIILNQELQFLEETVAPVQVTTLEGSRLPEKTRSTPGETQSLERIYFGDETDSLSSRTAAPKRSRE
jgi:hypothetical protein